MNSSFNTGSIGSVECGIAIQNRGIKELKWKFQGLIMKI